jgi:hypothetical protein
MWNQRGKTLIENKNIGDHVNEATLPRSSLWPELKENSNGAGR